MDVMTHQAGPDCTCGACDLARVKAELAMVQRQTQWYLEQIADLEVRLQQRDTGNPHSPRGSFDQ